VRHARRDAGRRGRLASALLVVGLLACAPDGADGEYALFEHLELAEELVIGADEGWAREAAERMAPRLEAELGLRVRVRPSDEAAAGARRVRILLGYPDTPALQPALRRLGVEVGRPAKVRLAGRGYGDHDGGALVATLRDPGHDDAPLTIFVALEGHDPTGWAHVDLDVARELRPTWRTGWQVWDGTGLLIAQGRLDLQGRAVPDETPEPDVPLARRLADQLADDPDLADLEVDLAAARQAVVELLGPSPTLEGFEPLVRVHRRPEDLALATRAWRPYRCAPASGVVDLVVAPGLFVDARAAFAELLARRGAREAREAWMVDALTRHVARRWWGRDLEEWCAHLQRAGLVPELEPLVSPDPDLSPHVVEPLRGLLLEVLLAERGPAEVRRLWREGGLVLDPRLRAAFDARLAQLEALHRQPQQAQRTLRRTQVLARPFRRGVALVPAHERSDPLDSGLGSEPGRRGLQRITELGADAVSLDVASFVHRPWGAHALELRARPAATVDDLELAAACASAREHDLAVLLKPELWLAAVSTLADEELVHTSGQWRLLFEAFERRLEHYALLAELARAELVSIGSDLRNATAPPAASAGSPWPPEHFEWRRRRWDEALARARAAFTGGLTYTVRWDRPLDDPGFWDALDFVGVALYPPVERSSQASAPPPLDEVTRALASSLRRLETTAAALGKRLLVVELGFPSTRDAWDDPTLPLGPADERAQALFVSAVSALRHGWERRQSAVAGLYVWCWSAEPGGGPAWERGYSIQGKQAELALQRAFREP
jgi:hypothetical protein